MKFWKTRTGQVLKIGWRRLVIEKHGNKSAKWFSKYSGNLSIPKNGFRELQEALIYMHLKKPLSNCEFSFNCLKLMQFSQYYNSAQ